MAWPLDLFNATPEPEDVRAQLQRLLDSEEFARAARLRDLLVFMVSQRLEGHEERLTEASIAAAVFQREQGFDPGTDSLVRTEAARLRARLDEYYRKSGRSDLVRIDIGRGNYLPMFLVQERAGVFGRVQALYWRLPFLFIGVAVIVLVWLLTLIVGEMH